MRSTAERSAASSPRTTQASPKATGCSRGSAGASGGIADGDAPAQARSRRRAAVDRARRARHAGTDGVGRARRHRRGARKARRCTSRARPAPSGAPRRRSAKLKGLRVIGSAGSPEKVEWLRSLGIEAFDYRETPAKEALADGIDVYFDNVGGAAARGGALRAAAVRPRGRLRRDLAVQRRAARAGPAQPRARRHEAAARAGLHRRSTTATATRRSSPRSVRGSATGRSPTARRSSTASSNCPSAFAGLFRGDNVGKMLVRVGPRLATART